MNLNNIIKIFAFLLISSNVVAAKLPEVKGNLSKIKKEYWKNLEKLQAQSCKPGVMTNFNKKLKAYRGEGFYLPIINQRIHADVFPEIIEELNEKHIWLTNVITKLKKLKSLPSVSTELKRIESNIDKALIYQEKVSRFGKSLTSSEQLRHETALEYVRDNFKIFYSKSFYLSRYLGLVDHFQNRRNHDAYYSKKSLKDKIDQKKIFLKRKLVEDGAPGTSHSGSDKFFRTSLDTLNLKIDNVKGWLSEDMRYDLEYAIDIAKRMTKMSPAHYLERFQEWEKQTTEQKQFYESLYKQSKLGSKELANLLSKKQRATSALKTFVTDQQLKTYLFWSKQSATMQALYAFETILFNEVGGVDPTGLERRDVLQVVLNRYQKAYYRRMKTSQRLYKLISAKGITRTQYPWLNILFNRGEFSFTLYYFKASHETFCPSTGSKLMKLRRENLDIALKALSNPEWDFKAERYFSRASMTGRIDMSTIWNKFVAIDERPGKKVGSLDSKSLSKSLQSGSYRYLYKFKSQETDYHVVEIKKKTYVFSGSGKLKNWYEWRNPHYFRYFALK